MPGKTEAWRDWGEQIRGTRRSEYEAFRRYLQHTPLLDQAIMYLEGNDLQRAFQHLWTAQDPFAIWLRQRAKDLLDGLDVMQTSSESLSTLVFEGPSAEQDEANSPAWEAMERLSMISP